MAEGSFAGFSRELLSFLAELEQNNHKVWFDQQRERYERLMLEPAKQFVAAMQPALATISAGLRGEPRVGGSIMRVARDTRFSKDKAPYKTHLDMMFWEGGGPSKESPSFFMRIGARTLGIGAGLHSFTPEQLERYRQAVDGEDSGAALRDAIRAVSARGFELNEPHYKRVPQGFAANHPNGTLLRHAALYAWRSDPVPEALFGSGAVEYCRQLFVALHPIQAWLVEVLASP
jgi:uncharacterized protein (TIGR02453 family)